jgi:ATP-dependent exoDNAse (exonuclease V) alpha subunit
LGLDFIQERGKTNMSFIADEEKKALGSAYELMGKENAKRGLKTAEEEYIEKRFAKLLEQFRSDFRAEQAKKEAEQKAAEENRKAAEEQEKRRKFIEATRHEYTAPPAKVLCERTGEYIIPTVASHLCDAGRCVHDAKRALQAGQITKLQYELMVENGEAKTGCVIGVAFDAPKDSFEERARVLSVPPANPLHQEMQYQPIKLGGPR